MSSAPQQTATANVVVTGHGNNLNVNNIQVSNTHAKLIKVLEEIRVALREINSPATDQLASEAKTLIEQPESLPAKMGSFLTKLSQRATEGGKLLDLVAKAQKTLEALTGGGIA